MPTKKLDLAGKYFDVGYLHLGHAKNEVKF
jgi:hypothetical protein